MRPYKDIKAEAAAFDSTLQATDPRLGGMVMLRHSDGSSFFWNHAFCVKVDMGEWIVVFTEHHGFYVYDATDVDFLRWIKGSDVVSKNLAPEADWQK